MTQGKLNLTTSNNRLFCSGLVFLLTSILGIFADALAAQSFTVIHSFAPPSGAIGTNSDGANPIGALVLSSNMLYGTASHGGANGVGAVFAVSTDGTGFTNLHTFSAISGPTSTNSDGAYPTGWLILSSNTLYGTATYGGHSGFGTLFSINTDGTDFKILHSFSAISGVLFSNLDGAHPSGGLLLAGNNLYGTATDGGAGGNGVVFALNSDGTGFTNLHSFPPAYYNVSGFYTNLEGANPSAGLTISSNILFGTTVYGGRNGQGTIFALNTDGTGLTNIHSFTLVARSFQGFYVNGDGANPASALLLSGNTLYGTAQYGGTRGYGTIFAVTTDGSAFTTLRNLNAGTDGAYPVAGLLLSGQVLYGAASSGGSTTNGTLFSLNTGGTPFTNLYNFSRTISKTNQDGTIPVADLVVSGKTLYGTTYNGGSGGSGTVFAFDLGTISPPHLSITGSQQSVTLTWPGDATGFTLQSAADLSSPLSWNNTRSNPVLTNGQYTVTISISNSQTFFRLRQ
jgi:uncharacterized repeat protein (TIGR03803 family)